jgi:hypothetical protein
MFVTPSLVHVPVISNRVVMPGLVPGIHVFLATSKTWMAGTSLEEPGHDG